MIKDIKPKKTGWIWNDLSTLQIFTPWKLRGLGIAGSLQGKTALSMEKGCKNCGVYPMVQVFPAATPQFPDPVVFMG